jgi:hypothetical protein
MACRFGDEEIDRHMVEHPKDTLGEDGRAQHSVEAYAQTSIAPNTLKPRSCQASPYLAAVVTSRRPARLAEAGAMREAVCDLFSAGQRAMRLHPDRIGRYALGRRGTRATSRSRAEFSA